MTLEGARLNVTDGAVKAYNGSETQLLVEASEMRAVLDQETRDRSIQATFTLLGKTEKVSHLANGEVRSQFGLKLRAQDGCNLIYVMWQFSPGPEKIAISVKSNPGHANTCGDRGYRGLGSVSTRHVRPGEEHKLHAALRGRLLTVTADDVTAWTGDVGQDAMNFDGPVGVRSDNARVAFRLSTKN